ncbi:MAG TPA: NAD(P)-dependent oxidoreductase [Gemmataceae bacterium]|nr:NAD(P)-dependent oxidoreductase [Gemmataceae bacterium]
MSKPRVLITGAAGFIGCRLCEVLMLTGAFEPRAFLRSTGSAARLARFPVDMVIGDLCDAQRVQEAVRGCDAAVHLAWGSENVMTRGLENVLRAARKEGVRRFVHMSSVAIFGNNPPPESRFETAPLRPTDLVYGNQKLNQELRVRHYGKKHGLPFVILRPPNVYGPFSPFTAGVIKKIRAGKLAIVDGGNNPCNLVYVDNLIQAVLLALWKPEVVGETFFITDGTGPTWRQCLEDHGQWVGMEVPHISRAELTVRPRVRIIRDSLRATPRVLLSSETRTALRRIPLVSSMEKLAGRWFERLSPQRQEAIRGRFSSPRVVSKMGDGRPHFDGEDNVLAAQARTVAHSIDKAKQQLGYTVPFSYREGMKLTEAWLRYARLLP